MKRNTGVSGFHFNKFFTIHHFHFFNSDKKISVIVNKDLSWQRQSAVFSILTVFFFIPFSVLFFKSH